MKDIKLMLVDDEERFLETTSKLLGKKGFDVITASGGREALSKLAGNAVHVVILDVKMPGMDGMETLAAIKRLYPLVEVIMLTGHATVESAIEGLRSGAYDYLMKPAEIDELIEKAGDAYDKRKRHEEKIRLAETKRALGSPREILKSSQAGK